MTIAVDLGGGAVAALAQPEGIEAADAHAGAEDDAIADDADLTMLQDAYRHMEDA